MSAEATNRVWEVEVRHAERLVLLALAVHADAAGNNIFPSIGLIAWKTGYSESQVRRIMQQLVSAGFLVVVREGGGRSKPTEYRFDFEAGTVKVPHRSGGGGSNGGSDGTMTPIPVQPIRMTPIIGNGRMMTPISDDNAVSMTPIPCIPSNVTPFPPDNPSIVTPIPDNPSIVTPFTDNPSTLTPIDRMEKVSFDELKGVIPALKGVIAMTPEGTEGTLKIHHHHRVRAYDDQDGGGGGGETMEYDGENVETSPLESQADEADVENVQRDLVDGLCALGVRPEMAKKAVKDGTVKADRDVNLCKRFIQSSTANVPAAVLWSQYLSVGRVPPPPVSDTSTVTQDQIAAARRMMQESDRRAEIPDQVVGLGGLAQALSGPVLRSIAPSITMPPGERSRVLPFPGRARP